jgi:hypothetical protein
LKPHPKAGEVLSDIAYRVIAIHGPGLQDSVYQSPATGTYKFVESKSPDVIAWIASARYDGGNVIEDAAGEYRDNGRTMCFKGECSVTHDASGPFFNPTFWGEPQGVLKAGMSWKVQLKSAWELGPAGEQTITVLSVDPENSIVVLRREGRGAGAYENAAGEMMAKRDGKQYRSTVKYGDAHWVGQAIFQHGVVVSDELLCITSVELTSPELGTIQAQQRQYMSLLEHPEAIAN